MMTCNLHHNLMKIEPRTIKHEKFKEMVKDWLDTHREEYCAFAEEVSKRDRSGFQQIFLYAQSIAPAYANAVKSRMADNRDEGFDDLEKLLEDADIGRTILRDFQSENPDTIAPAMLAWLYFGNSWELMVSYNEEIIQDKESGFFNRLMALPWFTVYDKSERHNFSIWNGAINSISHKGATGELADNYRKP